jgi:hypothetical protein
LIAQTLLLVAALVGQGSPPAEQAQPQQSPVLSALTAAAAPGAWTLPPPNGELPPPNGEALSGAAAPNADGAVSQVPLFSLQDALSRVANPDIEPLPPTDPPIVPRVNTDPIPQLMQDAAEPTLGKRLGLTPRNPPLANYYDPFSGQFAYGNAGVQPYKFGWWSYDDATWMPTEPARGTSGSFQIVEWNSYFRYARPIDDTLIFTWSPTWNAIWWTGPKGVPLPGEVDQITSDIQLSSASAGRWNFQIGFTPQMNSDFRRQLDSNAYMFDGRAVLFYQPSPNWRWAFGFAYWNRVIDRFIPYGGVIWSPNDRWEFRLFFPKTRISRYCGNRLGGPIWAYGTAEYAVQAWQVDMENASGVKTRGEMRDVRLMLGAEYQRNQYMAFAECGAVLDRQFYFKDASYNFGINPGLIARIGLAF